MKHKIIGYTFLVLVAGLVVGGVYYWQYGQNSNKKQETSNKTEDWKTYTNEQYGFEFKYPVDWVFLNTSNERADFRSRDYDYKQKYSGGDFPSSIKVTGMSVEVYFDAKPSNSLNEIKKQQKTLDREVIDTRVAGHDGLIVRYGIDNKVIDTLSIDAHFMTPTNGMISLMAITANSQQQEYDRIFDQILATFKFTNPQTQGTINSGITGTVFFESCPGNIMAVEPGSFGYKDAQKKNQCADMPDPRVEITIEDVANGSTVKFNTDSAGAFKVSLKPGDYVIKKPGTALAIVGEDTKVKVVADKYSQVNLKYSFLNP